MEAVCPETVVFGQEFRYELIVRNNGTSQCRWRSHRRRLPAGTKYMGSDPPAEMSGDHLSWMVGSLDAGADKRIVIRVKPTEEERNQEPGHRDLRRGGGCEGEGDAAADCRGGDGSEFARRGMKRSSSFASAIPAPVRPARMVVQAMLTDGLVHPQGAKLEMEMANLAAGETRTVPLRVNAARPDCSRARSRLRPKGARNTSLEGVGERRRAALADRPERADQVPCPRRTDL